MQIEPSKARILADCIEGMAADAEDKGKDLFEILLSLEDARTITRSLGAASKAAGGDDGRRINRRAFDSLPLDGG